MTPVRGVKMRPLMLAISVLVFLIWVETAWSSITKTGPKIVLSVGALLVFTLLIHLLLQAFKGCKQTILQMDSMGMSLQGGSYDERIGWDELQSVTLGKLYSGKRWHPGIVIELKNHRRIFIYDMYKIGIKEIFSTTREHTGNRARHVRVSVNDLQMY